MQTYEFYAKPENGVIRIPKEYSGKITSDVKVIILKEKSWNVSKEEASAHSKSDLLLPPTMNTKDWKFSREKANER